MSQIFRWLFGAWPQTMEKPGVILVSGRHQTPGLRQLGIALTGCTGGVLMINMFFGGGSILTRAVALVVQFCEPQWTTNGIFACLFITQFVIGCAMVALAKDGINLYALVLTARTTVKFFSDCIEVHGVRYPRDADDIQFLNKLPPQAVKLTDADGASITLGSMEECDSLRILYGTHTAVITTFLKPQHAGLFALACNAALRHNTPDVGNAFTVVTDGTGRGGPSSGARPTVVMARPVKKLRAPTGSEVDRKNGRFNK